MQIAGRVVDRGAPLFVVAEIGLNHGGDAARALALVDAAAEAGASAVKLQTLDAARLVAPSCPAPMHVRAASLVEFFRGFELNLDGHRAVAARARQHGLALVSTPLFEEAVDDLVALGCDALKIASGDITHLRLISRAARTGLPLIISTGMSSIDEAAQALDHARLAGTSQVALLHCVSSYPVSADAANLGAIATLAARFDVPVGLSDHGTDPLSAALAVALGATIYERHVVGAFDEDAVDRAVSSSAAELRDVVRVAARARQLVGHGRKECLPAERGNVAASRRGVYAARDLPAGAVLASEDLRMLRPVTDVPASRWAEVVGRQTVAPVAAGAPIAADAVDPPVGAPTS